MEGDSQGVIQQLQTATCPNIVRDLIAAGNVSIAHIPRQANMVAHYLAHHGQLHHQFHHFATLSSLPRLAKGALATDVSTPYIRL